MFRNREVPARFTYWWSNSTTPAARHLRRAYDGLPGTRVGWDSTNGTHGPSISYAGVADGVAHALAPMELWRHREGGAARAQRRGGHRLDPVRWARRSARGDLVVLGLYTDELAALNTDTTLVGPLRVHYLVELDSSPAEFDARFGKKDRENIRRGLRKHGWQLEAADSTSDFRLFYDRMHVPTMTNRHQGWVRNEHRGVAEHALFRRGLLFFLRRGDKRVAGVLCRVHGGTLVVRLAGVLDGDPAHYRAGAQLMLYYLVLRWAIEQGIRLAEMSGSRPFVSEGLFSFKRKFRPRIVLPGNHFGRKRLLVVPRRDTAEVRDFLRDHPMITIDPAGALKVVYPYDDDRPPRSDLLWKCPGIAGAHEVHLDEILADLPSPRLVTQHEHHGIFRR